MLPTRDASPLSCQGPIHIGAGCFVSGLDIAQSKALHGLELHDVVLQGHHVRLHGTPIHAFTLVGRLDSWEVGARPAFLHPHLQALRTQGCQPSSHSTAGLWERWTEG